MTENYHKWYSQYIGREYEMLVFGEDGIPVIFFPPANERYFSAKDQGLVNVLDELHEQSKFKLYTPDSYDQESWYNFSAEPSERVKAYINFENLIVHDIIAFTKFETRQNKVILCGAGFGGYHALNFGLKHPELISGIITLDGFYDIKPFIYGYYDDDCYFNNPPDYLPGLIDPWFIDKLKNIPIILYSGSKGESAGQNEFISSLLNSKGIVNNLLLNESGSDWKNWKNIFPGLLSGLLSDL